MRIANKFEAFQFSHELIDDFILLFNQSFTNGKRIDRDKVLKIFGNEGNYLGYLAYDGKKPIAFFGAVKLDFVYSNEIIKIAQSVNSMVLPKYRKFNLFYHLSELTSHLAKKENIKFIFGLPNSPELFHCLLDWTYLGPMKKYSFKIKTIPLAKIFWKLNFLRRIYLLYFNVITNHLKTQNTDNIRIKSQRDNNFYIPRSRNYLTYKKNLGAEIFTIYNTQIIVSLDYRIKLGDMEDISLDNFVLVLKKLKRICFWLGINEICYSVDSNSEWNQILKDKYFAKDDLQLMYYPFDKNYELDFSHITSADYDTF